MSDFLSRFGHEWMFFDGAFGTELHKKGIGSGELPETWNLTHPDVIKSINRSYFAAGADIVNANTFGANRLKYGDDLEEIIRAGVRIAREARHEADRDGNAYVTLDIGSTGKLLEPLGDLSFDAAVDIFAEVVRIGADAGADLVLIETQTDSYEAKAAVLAAKENCDLPVLVTMTYDEKGKLLTGGTPASTTALLEGLSVDGLGVNCSLGPDQMLPIVEQIVSYASVPVIVNPNAGLPRTENGQTVYDVTADEFAGYMEKIAAAGVQAVGGCCGTTPEFIRKTIAAVRKIPFRPNTEKHRTVVSSFSEAVEIGPRPVIIGERINPTGKKRFKQALRENDLDYICSQALEEENGGADILDVNVGLPEINEPDMMERVVKQLQSVTALPLQIDTTDPEALERALRHYNGKPMVNSVNGKEEQIRVVMPLVKKYGGVLVGLCIDEAGIPETADGRIRVAEKIYAAADRYGISRDDIVIDGLAMAISSDPGSALTTLETLRRVRDDLHGHSILGVSNISFGLPQRGLINANFFTMAMQSGLSCAIINPNNAGMMASFRSYLALTNLDPQCMGFIEAYAEAGPVVIGSVKGSPAAGSAPAGAAGNTAAGPANAAGNTAGGAGILPAGSAGTAAGGAGTGANAVDTTSLNCCIRKGLQGPAAEATKAMLAAGTPPLDIINNELIPALDVVGQGFEKGTLFLPQLLMSAEASKAAFAVIKEAMAGKPQKIKGKVIIATVKGDIHDIGKNIVKVLLENYGYDVIDLGKDVPPEKIVDTAVRENVRLVGLSALMTTTVVSMEQTIKLLREKKPDAKVVVGGAVMTQEYADRIGADAYGKDAMATVRYADEVFAENT